MKDILKPAKDQGSQKSSGARHWLRGCERYFECQQKLPGSDDTYKVVLARDFLIDTALIIWQGIEITVEGPVIGVAVRTSLHKALGK